MSPNSISTFPSLLFLFFSLAALIPFCFALRFSFPSFHQKEESLDFSANSNVDFQALQVTRNSGTPSSDSMPNTITKTSGQITYRDPLRLWHKSYSYAASFSTSFLLNMNNISSTDDSTGGGMAFYLSSHPAFPTLSNSYGMWLGLYDGSVVDPSQQQAELVAIEFDTFKDSFDPDDNHVGVDVNGSVESLLGTVSLRDRDVVLLNLSNAGGMNTSVWIDYDGDNHTLDVYLANQGSAHLTEKPATPTISGLPIDLRNYLPETVYVGFSASVGTIIQTHCVVEWYFSSTDFPNSRILIGTIVACSATAAAIALIILVLVLMKRRRRWNQVMAELSSLNYGPRKFSYQELKRATKGFSDKCKLGEGGFGPVYKGVLASKSRKTEVAVKCMSQKSKQGEREFKAEVMSMGRMRHKNLVQLLGWSYSGRSRLMLVYEYLPNGSLDQWIAQTPKTDERGGVMGWDVRFHVMKGLAEGLAYLHGGWEGEMVVLHRDLKPSNVMLDAQFNARIGDFGLARLVNCNQPGSAKTAIIAGTPGYLAPECSEEGIVSKESDMYSVGAIAIEIATGRRPSASNLYTLSLLLENSRLYEAADPRLSSFDPAQLELLLRIGLTCCHPDPQARLTISEVIHALSSSATPSISVPASKSPSPAVISQFLSGSESSVSPLQSSLEGR